MTSTLPVIAILGGTGALGKGLAIRWAAAGYPLLIGSREAAKAEATAGSISAGAAGSTVRGMDNLAAARVAEIAVVTVPFANHLRLLEEVCGALPGKILIDTTVPLVPPKVSTVQLPKEGSAAIAAQQLLSPAVRVVSAFQNVAAHKLATGQPIDCDVLVCGDDKAARETVIGMAKAIGLRGIDAGPLANSVAAEALTSILIGINRRYKVDGAGIRITGDFGASGS
jgi:hypothetical protein